MTKTPKCAAELRGSNEQCGMAEKSDPVPQSGGASPAKGDGSPQAVPATKKVYDRLLLWMLDVKQVKKDLKISPLVEVGPPLNFKPYILPDWDRLTSDSLPWGKTF